ncbi:DUF2325 domain-containing protein [Desulfobotulus mexicanus]|uniref:DUF2325 domain-containing protein n=1 Tax=Desulfobotulus mexicanus TaxID=2586642 RepID=A0A5S5MDN3_9BACT|nr:DUF2325 domain-containing protein [Desulfobotulus mexicanus]TYT73800.1 DUF2325 domain-containing protein [Desulfobotulus mexicanus]
MTPMPPNNPLSLLVPFSTEQTWICQKARFLALWEIPQTMKCPLVGTCLSVEDHQKLLKKAGICVSRLCPAGLHAAVMENIDTETRVARRIDTFLKKKFDAQAREWLHTPEQEIRKLWRSGIETGELELPLYIIASRSDISPSLHAEAFGTLHMLGHTAKRDLLAARRTIARLEKLLAEERETARRIQKQERQKHDLLHAEILTLKKEANTRQTYTAVVPEKEETSKEIIETLGERLRRAQEKNQALIQRVRKLEEERKIYRCDAETEKIQPRIEKEDLHRLQNLSFTEKKEKHPKEIQSLEDKRILVVGGRPCMQSLYRHAVEKSGGRFEYHDGCIHGGRQTLEARVRRSDLVLCPVNCNSHGACGLVKDICRKHGKCLRMLDSSSRSAITSALAKAADPAPSDEGSTDLPLIAGNRFSSSSMACKE